MSRDYLPQIVVDWEKMGDVDVPIDEFGSYLAYETVVPVDRVEVWDYRNCRGSGKFKSPRQVALDNTCNHDKLGNRRKFYWAAQLTSPYGALEWAIGNGDDFHCFDYAFLPDGRVVLEATANSETGCFIQNAGYEVCTREEAPDVALGMVDMGLECLSTWEVVRHNKSGWNQDPYYFYRCVKLRCSDDPPDFSDREKRFGGKRINKFCGLSV